MPESSGRDPGEAVWEKLLADTVSVLGRMARVAECYNAQTGEYRSEELCKWPSNGEIDMALGMAHKRIWQNWLAFSLEAQQADLILYLRSLPEGFELLLPVWREAKPFLTFMPDFASAEERVVYTSNLTVLVTLLCNEYALEIAHQTKGMAAGGVAIADRAVRIIREQYPDSHLSVGAVGQVLHVSDDYLGRLFRLQTGQSFREFLRDVRLREALDLLQHSDHSIKVISAMVGYSDPSHFIRYFCELTGSTPGAFRDRELTMKRGLLNRNAGSCNRL